MTPSNQPSSTGGSITRCKRMERVACLDPALDLGGRITYNIRKGASPKPARVVESPSHLGWEHHSSNTDMSIILMTLMTASPSNPRWEHHPSYSWGRIVQPSRVELRPSDSGGRTGQPPLTGASSIHSRNGWDHGRTPTSRPIAANTTFLREPHLPISR